MDPKFCKEILGQKNSAAHSIASLCRAFPAVMAAPDNPVRHLLRPFRHLHQRMEVMGHRAEWQHLHPAFQIGGFVRFSRLPPHWMLCRWCAG